MKVLQLIDSLEAGGAERVAVNFANGLVSEVERSFLCATRAEGLLISSLYQEVGYLFLNKKKRIDFKAIKLLLHFVKENQITIIHAHSTSYFLATIIKILKPKIKLIWHDHYGKSEFLNERPKGVLKLCSRFFNHVFSVNLRLETWAKEVLKVKLVSYLPNFAVKNETSSITKLKGEEGKRIVCLANLRPQKDHLNLLKAFTEVVKTHVDWTLHLVGQDFKDDYSKTIFNFIKENKFENKVFVYGSCEDTSAVLVQCTIGVLSSKSEGLPLTLLEYGLSELPVIATDVGESSALIINKKTGLLVKPEDSESLVEALTIYIENIEISKMYSKALSLHIRSNFSETSAIATILNVYKKL